MLYITTLSVPIITLVIIAVTRLIILLFKKNDSKQNGKRLPPSMPALPLVGSLPFLGGNFDGMPDFFLKKSKKLGPIFTFYAGGSLAVVLNNKAALVDTLRRRAEVYADKPDWWTEANVLNVDLRGLAFTHYDDKHKRYHKLALQIMKELGFGMEQEMESLILQEIELMSDEIRKYEGRQFDPAPLLVYGTASVISKTLLGTKFTSIGNFNRELIKESHQFLENFETRINLAPLIRFLPAYRKKTAIMIKSQEKIMRVLEEAIAFSKSKDSEKNFITRFIEEEGPDYNHQDLLYVLRDLCLGGSDTVGVSLMWALVEFANHPEIVARLQKEIDEVIQENRLPSLRDKSSLPYTEATILELMRRRTLVPLSDIRSTLKDTEACGYFIPQHCMVVPNLYGIHMDPMVWKDPETFRPERFLDKDNKVIGKNMIFPFGLGKRSCPGEVIARPELFLFISSLVQQFHIRPPDGVDSVKVKDVCGLVTSPTSYQVRLIPRLIPRR